MFLLVELIKIIRKFWPGQDDNQHYLMKPIKLEELLTKLAQAFEKKRYT